MHCDLGFVHRVQICFGTVHSCLVGSFLGSKHGTALRILLSFGPNLRQLQSDMVVSPCRMAQDQEYRLLPDLLLEKLGFFWNGSGYQIRSITASVSCLHQQPSDRDEGSSRGTEWVAARRCCGTEWVGRLPPHRTGTEWVGRSFQFLGWTTTSTTTGFGGRRSPWPQAIQGPATSGSP